jgi:hypothetical protein
MVMSTTLRSIGIISLLWLVGCQNARGLARPVETDCPVALQNRFFGGLFIESSDSRSDTGTGFATLLDAMGEPSLSCGHNFEAYRIVFSSQKNAAIAIRISSKNEQLTISATLFDSKAKKVLEKSERALTLTEFRRIAESVEEFNFWSRSPNPSAISTDHGLVFLHAGAWVFEGTKDNWYHAIARGALPRERDFSSIGKALFVAADYEVPEEFQIGRQ